MKNAQIKVGLSSLLALFVAGGANAMPWIETGDAGQTFGTAQEITASVDGITGTLTQGVVDPGDLFKFSWAGGDFSAEVLGADFDSELFLWDMGESLLAENDDYFGSTVCDDDDGSPTQGLCSAVSVAGLAAGNYLIGIGAFDSFGGNSFFDPDDPFAPITPPGAYEISFNAATTASAVNAPASLSLLGAGLLGVAATRRRRG